MNIHYLPPSEHFYQKLVENMNEAVWMGDKNERTIYANPKFCQLLGYTIDEIIGKESYIFWDPESAEKVKDVNKKHRKKGRSSSYQGNLITKDKKIIPVFINGTPTTNGGTIGIITDLSELKQKEESEQILSNAIQYSADAIVIFDQQGKIMNWNKGAKIIFGYRKDEIINQKVTKLINPKQLKQIIKNNNLQLNVELNCKHKNKSKLFISATLTPINSSTKNDKFFYLLIGRDITNQHKFEEELSSKYEKIREAYNRFGIIRRQMDYIFDSIELVSSNQSKKNIADYIVSSVIMLSKVDACILRLYDHKSGNLELVSSFGVDQDWHGKSNIKYTLSLLEKAYQNRQSLKIIDVTQEPKYSTPYLAKKNNLTSLLLIPLEYKGKLIGSLSLYASPDKKLEIFENEFIEKYARIIEIVIGSTM